VTRGGDATGYEVGGGVVREKVKGRGRVASLASCPEGTPLPSAQE
jgi:hypothetical protein